jgi:hypothetical protein
MSRTKECFIAIFFFVLGFLVVHNMAKADDVLKCYPNAEFMKMIDEKALVTLYNGEKNGKINEVMMTKDRHLYIVEYDKAADGNALQAKQYCVSGILNDVTFNDSAIEFLSKLLDKYKGQKT